MDSVFEDTDKSIALQIVSGREGISLRQAEALVYYNIDFSATSYWQSRDRMTTKDRLESDVYWVFAKGGIERDIYKYVNKTICIHVCTTTLRAPCQSGLVCNLCNLSQCHLMHAIYTY